MSILKIKDFTKSISGRDRNRGRRAMTRRSFLKSLAAAGVTVTTADPLWEAGKKLISIPNGKIFTGELFEMDYATRNIRFIGNPGKGATVLELHRWLQDQADSIYEKGTDMLDITDPNPSSRATDNIIQLQDNWYIENAQYLKDGSIKQRGELWAGIKTVGTIEENTVPFINGKPAIRSGHINQCIKVQPGEKVSVTTQTVGKTYCSFNIDSVIHGSNYAAITEIEDLFWNDPFNHPIYEVAQINGPPKHVPSITCAAERMAWKGKI